MLNLSQIFAYSAALGLAAAIPGPGMTALVAQSVSKGARAGFCLLFGLIVGDLIYLSIAVFGLAFVAAQWGPFSDIIRWASIVYLSYLAWQFWTAPTNNAMDILTPPSKRALIAAAASGLTITLGNPKTIAFYLALLPLVIELHQVNVRTWALMLIPVTVLILLAVGSLFVLGAIRIRHLLTSPRAQQWLYKSAAVMMALAAVSMAI